jgi:DME family drug/metabolite transporter
MDVSKNLAYGLMVLAAVMWATSGTFTSLAIDANSTVMQVAVYSTVFTAAVLFPLIAILDRNSLKMKKKDILPIFLFSQITGTFFAIAWYTAVDRTGVATAVILLYAYPSIVTVMSVFALSERLTKEKAIALPLTFVGAVLVVGANDFGGGFVFDAIGVAFGISAAVAGAIYYIWGKRFLGDYSANTIVLYMTLFSLPPLIILANPVTLVHSPLPLDAWWYLFLLGLLPGAVGPIVSMVALKHIQASRASIIASIEPVAAVLIAYLVLSDSISRLQAVGVMLVFLGVVMLRLREAPEERPEAVALER